MSSSVLCVIKIRANCGCLMPCVTRGVPCPVVGSGSREERGTRLCPVPAELGARQEGIRRFEQRALCQREGAKREWDAKLEKQKAAQVPGELQPLLALEDGQDLSRWTLLHNMDISGCGVVARAAWVQLLSMLLSAPV